MAECYYCYIFQYRLMQQIAHYCPSVQLFTKMYSDDEMVAIADPYYCSESAWYNVSTAYLLLKQPNGSYGVDIIDPYHSDIFIPQTNTGENIYEIVSPYDTLYYLFDGNKWQHFENAIKQ